MILSKSAARSAYLLCTLAVAGASIAACGAGEGDDVASSEGAQTSRDGGAREGGAREAGSSGRRSTVSPPPGTNDNPLDVDLVVTAWKKVKSDFYDTQAGYSHRTNGATPLAAEAQQCLGNCTTSVPYWSDLVCQYYCWHPSYEQVSPNVRGCFSYLARGFAPNGAPVQRPDPTTGQNRPLYYPEIYDYCLYQEYDAVLRPQSAPTYDASLIAANKTAGKKVGVLKWVDDNEAEAFKHVMWTWYNPFAFKMEDQQKAINQFYGVTLSKPDYTAADAADVAACRAKRPAAPYDPQDGTHCSSKKVLPYPRSNHPKFAEYKAYMETL